MSSISNVLPTFRPIYHFLLCCEVQEAPYQQWAVLIFSCHSFPLSTVSGLWVTSCLDFFRILGKRWHGTLSNLTMGDLITPERLALLVSVGTLVVVTIASVLTILFFTRWTYYWSIFCTEIMSETFSPQSFMTYIFIRNAWRRREVEEFTVEVTHMWKVHTQIKIQKGQILTYEN